MSYVIVSSRKWHDNLAQNLSSRLDKEIYYIKEKTELAYEHLKKLNATRIFFPHWSYKIPEEIYNNFECIIFHMTDVPFGRGGSPLQNLISRGIYETQISAIKCVEELDAGPVYLKRPLALYGSAEEIFIRANKIIEEMIIYIINQSPDPIPQQGEVIEFKRRKPEDGNIEHLEHLQQVFDYIRMLDADGYPRAFIETEHFRIEFERASLKLDSVIADVKITKKEGKS